MMSVGSAAELAIFPEAFRSHATSTFPFAAARTTGEKSNAPSEVRFLHVHAPVTALRMPTAISSAAQNSSTVTPSAKTREAFIHAAATEPSGIAASDGRKSAVPSSHTASAAPQTLLVPRRSTSSVRFADDRAALSRRYASASPCAPLTIAGAGSG